MANATLMCVLSDIKFAADSVLSGDRYLADGATDCREILYHRTYMPWTLLLPFWEKDPNIRNFCPKFLPFNREYLENGKSQHYVSIRA